ncbi:hypothetical protein [Microbacterium sp. NPDC096154]|uniref:hypothetical protein n=1 Tax=Microbacterium sp. NPDC096154 TaxID=3155549 RepID=UPI00331AAE00
MADVTLVNGADPATWVWVPLEYPAGPWDSAEAWADETGRVLAAGTGDRAPGIAEAAHIVATTATPFDGAVARLWHAPQDGATLNLAHVYLVDDDLRETELSQLCLVGFESGALQRVFEIEHAGFDEAVGTLSVAFLAKGGRLFVERWLGRVGGALCIVEAIDADAARLELVHEALRDLFLSLTRSERGGSGQRSPG